MKIKIIDTLILVDVLNILLILLITFSPSHILRMVVGIPFILFFPGYVLYITLFASKARKDIIEVLALGVCLSVALGALTGFILNFTSWGIRLETVLYPLAVFTFIVSIIAYIRQSRVPDVSAGESVTRLKIPGWGTGRASNSFIVILFVILLGSVGILGFTLASAKSADTFTEFYVLGNNGQADNYPIDFTIANGQVQSIRYTSELLDQPDNWGWIKIGIVNHEQKTMRYSVRMQIDGVPVSTLHDNEIIDRLSQIELMPGQSWEQELGFAPQHSGESQLFEILLYKGDETEPVDSVHLWINVWEAES